MDEGDAPPSACSYFLPVKNIASHYSLLNLLAAYTEHYRAVSLTVKVKQQLQIRYFSENIILHYVQQIFYNQKRLF